MSALSRNKGSSFEREVASAIYEQTGVKLVRNLEQVRSADGCDLHAPQHPSWPFSIECKRRADGYTYPLAWWDQARRAAFATGKLPCLAYRFDRRPTRFLITLSAIIEAGMGRDMLDGLAEVNTEDFCTIATEIMARRA